jgi:hypothetical protein
MSVTKFKGYVVPLVKDRSELERMVQLAPFRFVCAAGICSNFVCRRLSCRRCIWGNHDGDVDGSKAAQLRKEWLISEFDEILDREKLKPSMFRGKEVPAISDVVEFEADNYDYKKAELHSLHCSGAECQSGNCDACLLYEDSNLSDANDWYRSIRSQLIDTRINEAHASVRKVLGKLRDQYSDPFELAAKLNNEMCDDDFAKDLAIVIAYGEYL